MSRGELQRTAIEYLTHSWPIISGCLHTAEVCPVVDDCWARAYARRFPSHYGPGFRPILHVSRLTQPLELARPARIGVAFTGDFCGPQVHRHWQLQVLEVVRRCPQHTFVFLTKAGAELLSFNGAWPSNAWVGVSITGALPERDAWNLKALKQVEARVRWVSFEPLLAPWEGDLSGIQWVVIGAQTGPHARCPNLEWVGDIMEEAGKRGIALWLKRNMAQGPALPWAVEDLIQELPEGGNDAIQRGSA